MVFSHINRLIRCVIDCQIHLQDAVGTRHALELARSFSAKVWDNSPLQMKQLPQVGLAAIRHLAMGGINSIEVLEASEPHRIETLLSRNPPFGQKILATLKDFPKLRISMKLMGKDIKPKSSIRIRIKAEYGFLNERPPKTFHRRLIYVCLLIERSDGLLIDFRRISAQKFANSQDMLISATLTSYDQHISGYVMCDEIAGTLRYAELKHDIPASVFPPHAIQNKIPLVSGISGQHRSEQTLLQPTLQRQSRQPQSNSKGDDEFSDIELNDQDFVALAEANNPERAKSMSIPTIDLRTQSISDKTAPMVTDEASWNPMQLDNGKWACNHKCKDKSVCKHLCCREGLDKLPKPPKACVTSAAPPIISHPRAEIVISKAKGSAKSKTMTQQHGPTAPLPDIHTDQRSKGRRDPQVAADGLRDYKTLHQLHEKVNNAPPAQVITRAKPTFQYTAGAQPKLSFLGQTADEPETTIVSSDYEDDWMDDVPSTSAILMKLTQTAGPQSGHASRYSEKSFEHETSDLEAAMIGLDDSTLMARESGEVTQLALREEAVEHNMQPTLEDLPATFGAPEEARTERLFLSTDSPERPQTVLCKRSAHDDDDPEINETIPARGSSKKAKTNDDTHEITPVGRAVGFCEASPASSQTMHASTSTDPQPSQEPPDFNTTPPLPGWTKEVDPEFLAYFVREYGHLVEWRSDETLMP